MKKRAVLFLLVLCAVLCLALPAMATKYISTALSDEEKKNRYDAANATGEDIEMKTKMAGVDMTKGDWPLNTTMILAEDIIFKPDGLKIETKGVLTAKSGIFPRIDCDITNYGTIEAGTYTGTITNYGTITGGTFTGTVINATDGTHQGEVPSTEYQKADLSKAQMKIMNDSGNRVDGKNDDSFDGAYIEVKLKLASDESIGEASNTTLTKKILRGSSIWTGKPTRDGDPATTSTVFAYWRREGSTGTNDIYAHDYFNAPGSQITVTPVWCDHLVQFNVNGSTGSDSIVLNDRMLPMAFYKNEGQALSQNAFVWVNVDKNEIVTSKKWFLCWNTRTDGQGLNYPGEANKLNFTPDFNSGKTETTLYARWVKSIETDSCHTIIYQRDAKGSQREVESTDVSQASGSYTLKQNMFEPERGQVFSGWKVQNIEEPALLQPGQTILIAQQDDPPKTQTTITAQWQNLPVTEIIFDKNGTDVTGDTEQGTYFKGETLPLPKNGFVRTDYTFTGWNTKADGTGTGYDDEADITIEGEALVGKNVTLYAQWKSNKPETPTPQPETPTPTPTQKPVPPTAQPTNPPPQTGDASNQPLWLALCMASVAAMAALVVMKKCRFFQR